MEIGSHVFFFHFFFSGRLKQMEVAAKSDLVE